MYIEIMYCLAIFPMKLSIVYKLFSHHHVYSSCCFHLYCSEMTVTRIGRNILEMYVY